MMLWLLLTLAVGILVGIWLGINLNLNSLKSLGIGLNLTKYPAYASDGSKNQGSGFGASKTTLKPNPKNYLRKSLVRNLKQSLRQRLYHRVEQHHNGNLGQDSAKTSGYDAPLIQKLILSLRRNKVMTNNRLGRNLLNIWQQAPIGYLQVDADNHLIWCNQAAANLLGIANYQSGITKGQFLLQLVRSYELDQLIENTRHQGNPTAQDWIWHPLVTDPLAPVMRGQKITLRGLGFPLENGHVGIFLENRQEVITLIEQRDRWIADVTHELKTPLTAIRLVGELLETRLEPALQPWISRLLSEVNRLSVLVQDVLELARLTADSEQPLLRHSAVDLVQLIHQSWESLNLLSETKQIQLSYDGPTQCPITVDAQCIERLLINLLDNSIKHSPPQQLIILKLSIIPTITSAPRGEKIGDETNATILDSPAAPHSIFLEIIDHGTGFNPVDLPHIFKRFYCGDQSRKRTEAGSGGSGLGLAIVKQIVQLHCGDITIENHPETGGAWVKILLPVSPSHSLNSNP